MRRIVRGVLWLIKGVLLAIALGALLAWAWRYGDGGGTQLSKRAVGNEHGEAVTVNAAWREGRIGVLVWTGFDVEHHRDERVLMAAPGSGVEWSVRSSAPWFVTDNEHDSWGPVRWSFSTRIGLNGHYYTWHHVTLPSWLLSLSAGIWPLISLTLLVRRRSRRRLARAGCCTKCGYDLRATPHAGGELVTRCPECGTATSPSKAG